MHKKIAVLGVSGSVGRQTIAVIRSLNEHGYDISISAIASYGRDLKYIELIAEEFKVQSIGLFKRDRSLACDSFCYSLKTELDKFLDASRGSIYINAVSGMAGIEIAYKLLERDEEILMANKESLISLGHMFEEKIRQIIPIDSEHIALKKLLNGNNLANIERLVITATGGVVLDKDINDLTKLQIKEVLKHPKWSMGRQITVNSSTMANKAIEIVEARYLFGFTVDKIDAIIHSEALIHALVVEKNGSMLACISPNDMRLVIEEAIIWPRQIENSYTTPVTLNRLSFQKISRERYPLYFTILDAFELGHSYLIAANIANELAVNLFLDGKIAFTKIEEIVTSTLQYSYPEVATIESFKDLKNDVENRLYTDLRQIEK